MMHTHMDQIQFVAKKFVVFFGEKLNPSEMKIYFPITITLISFIEYVLT